MGAEGAETAVKGATRGCWCGADALAPFSDEYLHCRVCGTLVSQTDASRNELRVRREDRDLYGLNYFVDHARDLGHPDLAERSRLDLSERCPYWLKALLRRRAPPARTLEVGCGNGSFVALLTEAGYDATGLDLSPAVTAHARRTFDVPVLTGPLEDQDLPAGSFDVVVMMDVLEHLADPLALLRGAARLLAPDGLLLAQTPCFDGASLEEMRAVGAPFLEMLLPEEHLFLLGRSSSAELMARAGLPSVHFEWAIFPYDQFLVASRRPLAPVAEAEWREALRRSRSGRLVEAFLDAFDQGRSYRSHSTDQAVLEHELSALEKGIAWDTSDVEGDGVIARTVRALRTSARPEAERRREVAALQERVAALESELAVRGERLARLEGERATFARRLRLLFRPGVEPRRPALGLESVALLKRAFSLDWEQLLAFQYSKLISRGNAVIDVGAHSGLHTARFVQLVGDGGQVDIVEPLPALVENVLRPLYGGRRSCRIFQGALSDRGGKARFHVATGSEEESGLRRKRSYAQPVTGAGAEICVALATLDEIAGGRPIAFVKIGVEGGELDVLRGGRETLARSRPVLAVETSRDSIAEFGATPGALHDFLAEAGYAVASLLGEPLSREELEAFAASGVMWDFFLVPQERRGRLLRLLQEDASPYTDDGLVDLRAASPNAKVAGLAGFSFLENWGRWTDARLGPVATVQLASPLPRALALEIVAMGAQAPATAVDVAVEGAVRTLEVPATLTPLSCSFATSGEATVIAFRPHATACAADSAPGGDPRRRGVGIQSIRVLPEGGWRATRRG